MKKYLLALIIIFSLSLFSCEEDFRYDNICNKLAISPLSSGISLEVTLTPVEGEKNPIAKSYSGKNISEAFETMFTEHDNTIFKACENMDLSQVTDSSLMNEVLTYLINEERIQLNCTVGENKSFIEYYREYFGGQTKNEF